MFHENSVAWDVPVYGSIKYSVDGYLYHVLNRNLSDNNNMPSIHVNDVYILSIDLQTYCIICSCYC